MRSALISLFVSSAVMLMYAQQGERPNFSGTWVLNVQRSKFQIKDPPVSGVFTIAHREPKYHMSRTLVHRDGKSDVWTIDLITDGKREVTRHYRRYQSHTRMYWEGNVLVLDEEAGTEIELSVKGSIAYNKTARTPGWRLFRRKIG